MPIDKRIPRVLNSDADSKALDKVSMEDALNLYSGPDNESFVNGIKADAGDQVLKNIRSNVKVNEVDALPDDARLIGSVEDTKTDITYLFVYSSNGTKHGVWAYDKYGVLPDSSVNSLRLVYKSKQFNFPQNGFIKADIVYSNAIATFAGDGPEFDKDTIIYFTDGKNEPRKINAYRAIEANGQSIHGPNGYAEADFITACPKVPLKPIVFSFENDPSRSTSNFSATPGFQFAYQYVYKDGMESSISPYSDVAFPPSVVFQGAQPYSDHSTYNTCKLEIPLPGDNLASTNEIQEIKILAKQGVTGSFLIIDEISLTAESINIPDLNGPNNTYFYRFYNDKIGTAVSQDEVNKQFDSVPRKATTQTVSSNRLMYGNYLDGFNAVKTKCSAKVLYKDAPESFLSYDVNIIPSIEPIGSGPANLGKSVGFVLDFSELPSELEEGVELSLSVTIAPDRNWHAYTFDEGNTANSFHQTRQFGPQTQEGIDNAYNNVNFEQSLAETDAQAGAGYDQLPSMWGSGSGVAPADQAWNTVDTTSESNDPLGVSSVTAYGTSAANPIILKGGTVNFFAKIKTNQAIPQNAQQKINQAFKKALLNQDEEEGFEVLSVQSEDSYNLDVGLYSGKLIKQDQIRQLQTTTSPEARLICAVKTNQTNITNPPGGFFIVNKANVKFELKEVTYTGNYSYVSSTSNHFRIKLKEINNPEIYTCLHATAPTSEELHPLDWIAISREDLEEIEEGAYSIGEWLGSKGINPDLKFHFNPALENNANAYYATPIYTTAKQIGYLKKLSAFDLSTEVSLMDGEGGPGGGPSNAFSSDNNAYDRWRLYNQGSVTVNPSSSDGVFSYGSVSFYTGEIGSFAIPNVNIDVSPHATVLPMLFRVENDNNGYPVYSYALPEPSESNSDVINPGLPNFKRLQSPAEIVSQSFTISNFDQRESRSFKTEANHDFGIVYYDERGRHGFVNPLKTVFVEGYTDAERPEGGKGRVEILLEIEHDPPSWAYQYKIVYSKNTTVQGFVQYTSGGAYVSQNLDEQEIVDSNQNIYVSLNYLQGHPISYVSSFGARTSEGGLNFYKFQEGDKLRVISYFEGEDRVYRNYEFDVAGTLKLGETDNPLSNAPVADYLKGDFVILKNNPSAFGFTHGEILSGSDKWGDNCIIELRTPLKDVDADQLIFYEMSDTYDVVRDASDNLVHDQEVLHLTNGDVWFRPVATNVREYENGEYVDLIFDADPNDPPPKPNFKNVFLETSTATDLFRGDNLGLGRPNFVFKGAKETVREATITYSDPSNPEGKRLNYSSFNASLFNFKDLPERFGSIQYLSDKDEFLLVLQEDKVSLVPVNKNILSDASGSDMVIASREVLGKAVFYPGQNGVSTDPSSVFDSGKEAYFCNRTLSTVYRWTKQNGVEEISKKGVSSVIRASIQRALNSGAQVRIVGGYDPLKDEYLFTLVNPTFKLTSGVGVVEHPTQIVDPDVDPTDDNGDEAGLFSPAIDIGEAPTFQEFVAGGAGETSSMNVFNTGNSDLEIKSLSFTGGNFEVRNFQSFYISPQETAQLNVTFTPPSQPGEILDIMTITSSDPNNPNATVTLSATVIPSEEVGEASELVQAINELLGTNYTDDDMSADLAIDYLKALENQPEEAHPTYTKLRELLAMGDNTSFFFDYNFSGRADTSDLLVFLGALNRTYDVNDSFFTGQSVPIGVAPPDPGGDPTPPEFGGYDPVVIQDPPSVAPDGTYFESTGEAIEHIISIGDMTVNQFNGLRQFVKPKVKADINGDGVVGTNDLLDLLQYYAVGTNNGGQPAFISPNPINETASPSTNSTLLWLIGYSGGGPTAGEYWNLTSFIRKEVLTDINGDGVVGQNDHLALLSEWTIEQNGEAATPLDPNTPAFS